jgi:hypothetical protein
LALACYAHAKQGSLATASRSEPRVFAHYMPWFKIKKLANGNTEWEHWKWFGKGQKHDPDTILENGRRDIASVYYPLAGPYDGCDPVVLEYHMLTAKAAGIDGFIADWYGPEDYSDQVFSAMVKAAEKNGMKVAICLEEKTFFPPYSSAKTNREAQAVLERQLRHVLSTHGGSPAYLWHRGQPVFYIFKNYGTTGHLSPEEFAEVLSRFEGEAKILLVRGTYDPTYAKAARGTYVWCPDGSSRVSFYEATKGPFESGEVEYWVGGAYPGFNDTPVYGWGNGPRVVDRRGTKEYEETWSEVLRYRPPYVQISTWNDFEEGTTIEPSEEYRFTFLDLTEKFVGEFTGRDVELADNAWPLRIYHLRRKVQSMSDPEAKADWNERIDKYARSFAQGSKFLMGWRLKRLEAGVADALQGIKEQETLNETRKETTK